MIELVKQLMGQKVSLFLPGEECAGPLSMRQGLIQVGDRLFKVKDIVTIHKDTIYVKENTEFQYTWVEDVEKFLNIDSKWLEENHAVYIQMAQRLDIQLRDNCWVCTDNGYLEMSLAVLIAVNCLPLLDLQAQTLESVCVPYKHYGPRVEEKIKELGLLNKFDPPYARYSGGAVEWLTSSDSDLVKGYEDEVQLYTIFQEGEGWTLTLPNSVKHFDTEEEAYKSVREK